ncbi:unnamed protein product [Malus baccata var. baccata]
MKKAKTTSMPTQSLLDELLVQKLMKVVSQSLKYLFIAKMVCKKFNQIIHDHRIFEHINIREFEGFNPLTSWSNNEDVSKFLKWMAYIFQNSNKEVGIEALKMAISKGHEVATEERGIPSMKASSFCILNPHISRQLSVMECRDMVHRYLSSLWVNREVIGEILQFHDHIAAMKACRDCGSPQGPFTIRSHWNFFDHENFSNYNSCRWH